MSTNNMTASSMMDASAGTATLKISASNGELRMPPGGCAATELPKASGPLTVCAASVGASSWDEETLTSTSLGSLACLLNGTWKRS